METLIMVGLMVAVMYFAMIRPENKRKKKNQEMRDNLKKGDVITTIGGIVGRVVAVTADTFVIETSDDRVRVEFAKWALSTTGPQNNDQSAEEKKSKKKKVEASEEPVAEIPAEVEEK